MLIWNAIPLSRQRVIPLVDDDNHPCDVARQVYKPPDKFHGETNKTVKDGLIARSNTREVPVLSYNIEILASSNIHFS